MTLDNIHKLLLDSLKTGVMLLDGDLRLRYINMEAEQLLPSAIQKPTTNSSANCCWMPRKKFRRFAWPSKKASA